MDHGDKQIRKHLGMRLHGGSHRGTGLKAIRYVVQHFAERGRARRVRQATHGSYQRDARLSQRMHLTAEHDQFVQGDLLAEQRQVVQPVADGFALCLLMDRQGCDAPPHEFRRCRLGARCSQRTLLHDSSAVLTPVRKLHQTPPSLGAGLSAPLSPED